MTELFNGWRWKIGLVTLVLACVFLTGWGRSMTKYDILCLNFISCHFEVMSIEQSVWMTISGPTSERAVVDWASGDLSGFNHFGGNKKKTEPRFDPHYYLDTRWRIDGIGFHMGSGTPKPTNYNKATYGLTGAFSWWYLITPTTLISAWLLLFKPRSAPTVAANRLMNPAHETG
jgi:hypothetical protein